MQRTSQLSSNLSDQHHHSYITHTSSTTPRTTTTLIRTMVSAIKSVVGYGIVISDPVALNILLADGEPGNVKIGKKELDVIYERLSPGLSGLLVGEKQLFEAYISHSERASGMVETGASFPPPALAIHFLGGYDEEDQYAYGHTLEVWAQDKIGTWFKPLPFGRNQEFVNQIETAAQAHVGALKEIAPLNKLEGDLRLEWIQMLSIE
ncbi:hypothetical protein BDN72DRAFT_880548 [Pluteus cervinus]|uniref:Uncharacterized protein n=1 Tax=Pluteus cervinus TaxID=181527 RepID=A0ACD3AJV9_9AGAR|nr:hypothetical protein BDN72DRAFT_880548 [Pluteus cervinus]